MFAQRIKIPVCTDLNKNLFKTVEILFYNFVVHVPWNKLKTQWNLQTRYNKQNYKVVNWVLVLPTKWHTRWPWTGWGGSVRQPPGPTGQLSDSTSTLNFDTPQAATTECRLGHLRTVPADWPPWWRVGNGPGREQLGTIDNSRLWARQGRFSAR